MTRGVLLGLLIAAWPLQALSAKAKPKEASAGGPSYVSEAAPFWDFACEVPKGWEVERSAYMGAAAGAVEEHPMTATKELSGGASAVLAVELYRTGHPDYSSVDAMLRSLQSQKGTSVSPVKDVAIGKQGAAGRRFEATQAEQGLRTGYLAIQFRRNDGFRLLRYSAPVAEYERYLPAFERLIASFRYTGSRPKQP